MMLVKVRNGIELEGNDLGLDEGELGSISPRAAALVGLSRGERTVPPCPTDKPPSTCLQPTLTVDGTGHALPLGLVPLVICSLRLQMSFVRVPNEAGTTFETPTQRPQT
jgi:hypothetical protein